MKAIELKCFSQFEELQLSLLCVSSMAMPRASQHTMN